MNTENVHAADMPLGLKRLMKHLGPDLLEVNRVRNSDDYAFSTSDADALIEALIATIRDSNSDADLSMNAALMLGKGQDLAPLPRVLPNLIPLLTDDEKQVRYRAAMVLEFAAPAPGNEDLAKEPSPPTESLKRIAERFPELRDAAEHIIDDHLKQKADEPRSYRPRPA
jgi:HEAT repeat protein